MLPAAMSTSTTISEEGSVSSGPRADENSSLKPLFSSMSDLTQPPALKPVKKRRNKPGNPDPNAEVVALSPGTLMCTNRYACEVCGKGFQREQNLQLHRRGHNLPWRLKQAGGGAGAPRKKVYVCPEESCPHHQPARALGDLTGIKKHFWRKHGEKRWTCERCSKKYAVMSDWKAHGKTCGTREYRCDCGAVFSRKDSFATHRAFCDALAQESARFTAAAAAAATTSLDAVYIPQMQQQQHPTQLHLPDSSWNPIPNPNPNPIHTPFHTRTDDPCPFLHPNFIPRSLRAAAQHLPDTALLHSAVTAGQLAATRICIGHTTTFGPGVAGLGAGDLPAWQRGDCPPTRDFLGMAGEEEEALFAFANSGRLGGSLHFMSSPAGAAATRGCSSHANTITTETKPKVSGGSGLHQLPTPSTSASQARWRLLDQ